jgi:hypothetical protein
MSIDWLDQGASGAPMDASSAAANRTTLKLPKRADGARDRSSLGYAGPQKTPTRSQKTSGDGIGDPMPSSMSTGWHGRCSKYAMASNLALAHVESDLPGMEIVGREQEAIACLFDELARAREELRALRSSLDQQTTRRRWWHLGR